MPKYGQFRYGNIYRYGAYDLVVVDNTALGPHIPYRIRSLDKHLIPTDWLQMNKERIILYPENEIKSVRIKADNGEWVYVQRESIPYNAIKIRIRTLNSTRIPSPWVYAERATLHLS